MEMNLFFSSDICQWKSRKFISSYSSGHFWSSLFKHEYRYEWWNLNQGQLRQFWWSSTTIDSRTSQESKLTFWKKDLVQIVHCTVLLPYYSDNIEWEYFKNQQEHLFRLYRSNIYSNCTDLKEICIIYWIIF